jgi:hypothetical protein
MPNIVDYLDGASYFQDFTHASRLYLSDNQALLPKSGWIYYVEFNVNQKLLNNISDPTVSKNFSAWYSKSLGNVNLLAKMIDMPKFSIQTEKLNQYNRTTIVQKKIEYGDVTVTFHDDSSNCTTNLWKSYYQYYFGDSVGPTTLNKDSQILPKYVDTKYKSFTTQENYGLNNNQTVPFFTYVKIYQLYQGKYTSVKLVNPVIKEWSHDQLDQTQGNRMLSSRMTLQYETVIYDTDETNKTLEKPIGFEKSHYDNIKSPLIPRSAKTNQRMIDNLNPTSNPGGSASDLLTDAINKQSQTKAQAMWNKAAAQSNFGGIKNLLNPSQATDSQGTNTLGIVTPNTNNTADQTQAVLVDTSQGSDVYSDRNYDVGF